MDAISIRTAFKQLFTSPSETLWDIWSLLHHILPSSVFLKPVFRRNVGYTLNLKCPMTFNEKLNWLKVYNRKPEYTTMVDKYLVKEYVGNRIGEKYVIPVLGVWKHASDINFDSLPNQFVLKTNHNSCCTYVIKDKSSVNDFNKIREDLDHAMSKNLFYMYGEWPYKNVSPRIIAEEYLDDHKENELQDYKWWCFDGVPTFMYFSIKRKEVYENFYDMDFNPVQWINHSWPRHFPEFNKPEAFEEMKELATKLSKGIPFVRVDFYYVDGKVYFGELTFFDYAGMRKFNSYETDLKLGDYINLP